jgi:hypothetical protein
MDLNKTLKPVSEMEAYFFLSEYKGRRGLNPNDLAINLKYFHKSYL